MSRRERLAKRKLPSATVSIRLDPTSTEADEAREELRQAELDLRLAEESPDHTRLSDLREALQTAQARVDAAFEYFVINAIPAHEFEALINDHPPSPDQRKEGMSWNRETFFPALLAACVEGSESARDWADMLKDGTFILGEWTALISTALQLNDRSPDVNLGKGSTSIRS